MKVKHLIEMLQKMPQESDIWIDLRQSKDGISIDSVETIKLKCVDRFVTDVKIVARWKDFNLDEEEMYFCEKELDEEYKEMAIDMMIDKALGK